MAVHRRSGGQNSADKIAQIHHDPAAQHLSGCYSPAEPRNGQQAIARKQLRSGQGHHHKPRRKDAGTDQPRRRRRPQTRQLWTRPTGQANKKACHYGKAGHSSHRQQYFFPAHSKKPCSGLSGCIHIRSISFFTVQHDFFVSLLSSSRSSASYSPRVLTFFTMLSFHPQVGKLDISGGHTIKQRTGPAYPCRTHLFQHRQHIFVINAAKRLQPTRPGRATKQHARPDLPGQRLQCQSCQALQIDGSHQHVRISGRAQQLINPSTGPKSGADLPPPDRARPPRSRSSTESSTSSNSRSSRSK